MDLLDKLLKRYPDLSPCKDSILAAFDTLKVTFAQKGQLLIAGNGGSAADADHIAGELLKGFAQKRPLSDAAQDQLGWSLAGKLQDALPSIPLPNFTGLLTAYGNDCDPDYGFAQLVWGLGRKGDALLCLSTSGNSKNILHAADVARSKGLKTIALTGASGGALRDKVEVSICVPSDTVHYIQERHLPIYHTLCLWLEETFFGNTTPNEVDIFS